MQVVQQAESTIYNISTMLKEPTERLPYDFARYTSFGIKHIFERNNFDVIEVKNQWHTF
jgi:hypothetical protein